MGFSRIKAFSLYFENLFSFLSVSAEILHECKVVSLLCRYCVLCVVVCVVLLCCCVCCVFVSQLWNSACLICSLWTVGPIPMADRWSTGSWPFSRSAEPIASHLSRFSHAPSGTTAPPAPPPPDIRGKTLKEPSFPQDVGDLWWLHFIPSKKRL